MSLINFNNTNCVYCEQKEIRSKLILVDKNPEIWECPLCHEKVELPFLTERIMMLYVPLHWQGVVNDVKMIECYGCHTKFMGYKDELVCRECFEQTAYYPSGVY
jgi:rubredoxin